MGRQGARPCSALDGRGRKSARGRRGLPRACARRQRGRRRNCRAAGARSRRAAIVRHRRRRVHARARCARPAAARVRWPRDGARRRNTRPVPERRPAARLSRRGSRRQVGRRARPGAIARGDASQARAPCLAATVRACDRAGGERVCDVGAPAPARGPRALHHAAAPARVLVRRQRQGAARGLDPAQSGVRQDAARHLARRGARFLRRGHRARHRRVGDAARLEPRRHHAARSCVLRRRRARARVRRLPRVPRVRVSVALVRGHRRAADAEDARALRHGLACRPRRSSPCTS